MTLRARLELQRGRHAVQAAFDVSDAETLALIGPNGAGKSTCLFALAGLLRLQRGHVTLGDEVFDGGQGGPFVPPEERGVGMVFQDQRLFQHASVLDNVAYGPRCRGTARAAARGLASTWLERVGLPSELHTASPGTLSGGQAQRVALARALAGDPRLLLLDEPLSAVDASARIALRRELCTHLAAFQGPRVVVTHDVADALALADRMAVLEEGRVVQTGTLVELSRRPATPYVADLLGINALSGVAREGRVHVGDFAFTVATSLTGDVLLTVHPRSVSLYRERPAGSPRNVWPADVAGVEPLVDRARVQLSGPVPLIAEVTPASVEELRLAEGGVVWVAVKATELSVTER